MTKRTVLESAKRMRTAKADQIGQITEETRDQAMARKLIDPSVRHSLSASVFSDKLFGPNATAPNLQDFVDQFRILTKDVENGDINIASRMLVAQALTLDTMFSEMSRRTALNLGERINAAETYGRLALKAQSNCRATLEALAKLHQPREQIVRHVHVNDGGQAVVAEHFHHHTGGQKNGKSTEQSHATGPVGSGPSLPGPNAGGGSLPVSGGARAAKVPNARGKQSRRA